LPCRTLAASHGHCLSLLGGIYFRKEIKAALARVTELGPSGGVKQVVSPELLDPFVDQLKRQLQLQTTDKDKQLDILLHWLALTNIQLAFERVYRNIFGSQATALVSMNNVGGASEEIVRQIYAQAAAQYPDVFKAFPFETWIAFLLNSGLAVRTDNRYQTTAYGRGFLKYVVDAQLFIAQTVLAWAIAARQHKAAGLGTTNFERSGSQSYSCPKLAPYSSIYFETNSSNSARDEQNVVVWFKAGVSSQSALFIPEKK